VAEGAGGGKARGPAVGYRRDARLSSWFGHIAPGTGTRGFAGWTDSARIVHDDQGAYFEINLD